MIGKTVAVLLSVLLASGCSDSADPSGARSSAGEAASAEAAGTPSDWHTIEYGRIALDVPSNWSLNGGEPCTGLAIVSPPRFRASCPPRPSALIKTAPDAAPSTDQSAAEVVVDGVLVRLTGVDPKTARTILASVRTR